MEGSAYLLRFRDDSTPIRFSDGFVAAIHSLDKNIIITSPNSQVIYEPPLGSTRSLVRRDDGLYADDDYIQWPQPWNEKYSHLCAIPMNPREDSSSPYVEDCIMWYPISDLDIDVEGHGDYKTYPSSPALLAKRVADDLKRSFNRLRDRITTFRSRFTTKEGVLKLADLYFSIIEVCFLALEVSRPLRDIRRGVTEIQRAWLSCVALFDFMEIYNPRMSGSVTCGREAHKILGASTDNGDTARALFNAGVPVYFMRHIRDIGRANILSIVSPISSIGRLCHRDANPPYQMIFMGPAHADAKFDAILHHARSCFRDGGVFSRSVHYEGHYRSSWSVGTSLSRQPVTPIIDAPSGPSRAAVSSRRQRKAPFSMEQRKKYRKPLAENSDVASWYPLPESQYTPLGISTWIDEIQNIDTKHVGRQRTGPPTTRCFIVPPPHLFIKPDGCLRVENMSQWLLFRPAWLRRCYGNLQHVEAIATATWKELLSYAVHRNPWKEKEVPTTKAGHSRKAAWELLKYTMDNFSEQTPPTYICGNTTLPDSHSVRFAVWQLTEINFRYEISCLDKRMDTSHPKAQSFSRYAEYQLALISHANHRTRLMNNVFHGAGLFNIDTDEANVGLAAKALNDRLRHTHALWILMGSWDGEKPLGWNIASSGLTTCTPDTAEWEKIVIRFYLQTGYNVLDYVPCLPYRL